MKPTFDLDDALYRRLKMEAARRGRTIRDIVADGVRLALDAPQAPVATEQAPDESPWFGALRGFAANARGEHDLAEMRESIA